MSANDADYFRDRAAAERALAVAANDPVVAAVHGELAERYDALVEGRRGPMLRQAVAG